MHPVNKLLLPFGIQIIRERKHTGRIDRPKSRVPRSFASDYDRQFRKLKTDNRGFLILKDFYYEAGEHPSDDETIQCEFASSLLYRLRPETILDIGSYRKYVIGLLAHTRVTTLDVRPRQPFSEAETVLTSDAKQIDLPDNQFDAVVALCALEHFGLGRYGDEFDLEADRNAAGEMKRLLKPGGRLIFTTHITNGQPAIAFNAHRIYSREMILKLCKGLTCEDERFFDRLNRKYCSYDEVTSEVGAYSIYCGCWRKD